MIATLIANVAPYLIGLMALVGLYWRGKHNGRVAEANDAMVKRAAAVTAAEAKRREIENEIDQDVDLVRRAARAGIVRHAEH